MVGLLGAMGFPSALIERATVPVHRLETVVRDRDVGGIYLLKIDAEGHVAVILEDSFRTCAARLYPHHLRFETNRLGDNDRIHRLIAALITLGYDIVHAATGGDATDTHLCLNLHRLAGRTSLGDAVPGYDLAGYPEGYDPAAPPHGASLADAQRFCLAAGQGGKTYQFGRYEVREGRYLMPEKGNAELRSWLLLP